MTLIISPQLLQLSTMDTLPEAGRKILLRYLHEMVTHEPIARLGEDIEGVHKMRVATRRLRTMYQVLGQYFPQNYLKPYPQQLRQTANILGGVRDLDVFLDNLAKYIQTQLDGDSSALQELIDLKLAQHEQARQVLLSYLNCEPYQRFIHDFAFLLQQPIEIDHLPTPPKYPLIPKTYRLDHMLPMLVLGRYEDIRRHETRFPLVHIPALHRVRIECKRLRYTLEAFEGVLGQYTGEVVTEIKLVQEHLGDLNDAAVAIEKLQIARAMVSDDGGIKGYQAHWQKQLDERLRDFPKVWNHFKRIQVRRWLMLNLAKL